MRFRLVVERGLFTGGLAGVPFSTSAFEPVLAELFLAVDLGSFSFWDLALAAWPFPAGFFGEVDAFGFVFLVLADVVLAFCAVSFVFAPVLAGFLAVDFATGFLVSACVAVVDFFLTGAFFLAVFFFAGGFFFGLTVFPPPAFVDDAAVVLLRFFGLASPPAGTVSNANCTMSSAATASARALAVVFFLAVALFFVAGEVAFLLEALFADLTALFVLV